MPTIPQTAPLSYRLPSEVYALDGEDGCYTGPAVGRGSAHLHAVSCETGTAHGHRHSLGASEDEQRQAKKALEQMQGSLKSWLRTRKHMDEYVAGKVKAPALFRRAKPLPPAVVATTLRTDRYADEQELAEVLYALLVECGMDSSALPIPDVAKDPNVAVKLATVAIKGKVSSSTNAPAAQGIVWFVLAIPIAGVVLVVSQWIKSKADVIKEKEKIRCIESGACTDEGFWLKIGSIGLVSWLAWDKLGLREAVRRIK